jgi:hypothetical protein
MYSHLMLLIIWFQSCPYWRSHSLSQAACRRWLLRPWTPVWSCRPRGTIPVQTRRCGGCRPWI